MWPGAGNPLGTIVSLLKKLPRAKLPVAVGSRSIKRLLSPALSSVDIGTPFGRPVIVQSLEHG